MNALLRVADLPGSDQNFAQVMIDWGVLPALGNGSDTRISRSQYERLCLLINDQESKDSVHLGFQLFPSEHELFLACETGLLRQSEFQKSSVGASILLQLLPHLLTKCCNINGKSTLGYVDLPGSDVQVVSRNLNLLRLLDQQHEKFHTNVENRAAFFARSASYMGSKASLAPALIEILDTFCSGDAVVVDLMCGSGAASNAFSRSRKVYASDAQLFSQYLAVVQAGGMTFEHAGRVASFVTHRSLEYYSKLPSEVYDAIDKEEYYLTTELSEQDKKSFIEWASEYKRVGEKALPASYNESSEFPGNLFINYYANLFFGVRQAAEIDCIRKSIDALSDPNDRAWALGALICAVSACADNYGGHFAQPKFDITQPLRVAASLKNTLFKRSLSITHEFEARLLNLARESESFSNSVDVIPGPWKKAVESISSMSPDVPVVVYIDPPYTREEYSRYYHVLETLVRYDYPKVSGKSSAPIKGSAGRFASEFFTRNSESAEKIISEIICSCLRRGWDCIWSYSSSGLAYIPNVIARCEAFCEAVEFFRADYAYKGQGKQRAKSVDEYVVVFKKKSHLSQSSV